MHIILITNYRPDQQYSMLQFSRIMREGLEQRGHQVTELTPQAKVSLKVSRESRGFKWLAYVDKYILFPIELRKRISALLQDNQKILVHICDHSNAVYATHVRGVQTILTCHDLIAIRASLGEFPQQKIGITGKLLQAWIRRSIAKVDRVVCDSSSTESDLNRIVPKTIGRSETSHLCFEKPFQKIEKQDAIHRLGDLFPNFHPYKMVLHVGNSAWYKNRWQVIRSFHELNKMHPNEYALVLVGAKWDRDQEVWVEENNLKDRVVNLTGLSSEQLEALYSLASVFVFPSLYEGFGWPPLEAQCCGVPVVSSEYGSLFEILDGSAFVPQDMEPKTWANAIHHVAHDERVAEFWSARGLENVKRFTKEKLIDNYINAYKKLC
jgi:glycosyltransferase involved in cell wall biosynthesis